MLLFDESIQDDRHSLSKMTTTEYSLVSTVELSECSGPSCPQCGCRDARILMGLSDPDCPACDTTRYVEPVGVESFRCRRCGESFHSEPTDSEWPIGKAQCKYCGLTFRFGAEEESQRPSIDPADIARVTYRCPSCRSNNVSNNGVPVGSSMCYYKCRECGRTFKKKRLTE